MLAPLAVLRRARASDAAAVRALLESVDLDADFAPQETHVLERDGRIVATARMRPLVHGAVELAGVAVAREAQGTGLGTVVVKEALAQAQGPVLALALAPGFFERLGFQRLPATPPELREKAEGICASTGFVPMRRDPTPEEVRARVQEHYGAIARAAEEPCCGPACCASDAPLSAGAYSAAELSALPPGAELGLGTGNPVREARIRPGETVLDLGSGAGVDVFLASRATGPDGRAIGVDVTHDMVARARRNAAAGGYANVAFHEAPIERLPLADDSVDVIVSNCVLNLSADKSATLREAWRVLRPGGRLVASDTLRAPEAAAAAPTCDCMGGALTVEEWTAQLRQAGFADVGVTPSPGGRAGILRGWKPA